MTSDRSTGVREGSASLKYDAILLYFKTSVYKGETTLLLVTVTLRVNFFKNILGTSPTPPFSGAPYYFSLARYAPVQTNILKCRDNCSKYLLPFHYQSMKEGILACTIPYQGFLDSCLISGYTMIPHTSHRY